MASEAERRVYLFQRHPAVIALGYWFTFLHGMCIQPGLASPKKHLGLVARGVCARRVPVCDVHDGRVEGGAAGRCAAQHVGVGFGAYLFTQHNFPAVQYVSDGEWAYEFSALKSSSFLDLNPDALGHRQHRLPPHSPPQRPNSIQPVAGSQSSHCGIAEPLSSDFDLEGSAEVPALKVWDDERGRMVSLDEV